MSSYLFQLPRSLVLDGISERLIGTIPFKAEIKPRVLGSIYLYRNFPKRPFHIVFRTQISNAIIIGIVAGVLFIIVQPVLGMSTLTSRHADAYIELGQYTSSIATFVAWSVHLLVSVFYAVGAAIVFRLSSHFAVSAAQTLLLTWLTTLIAPPANALVIKLLTTGQFPILKSLPSINTQLDVKFILHLVFFVFVIIGLYGLDKSMRLKKGTE